MKINGFATVIHLLYMATLKVSTDDGVKINTCITLLSTQRHKVFTFSNSWFVTCWGGGTTSLSAVVPRSMFPLDACYEQNATQDSGVHAFYSV